MRLTYLGYLGLGTTEPDQRGHIEDVTGGFLRLTRKDDSPTAADKIGRVEFETQDAAASGVAAYVEAVAEGSGGEVGLSLATGTGGSATERIRVKNTGVVKISAISEYADNATALAGGLVAGDLYRTGDDLKIVH
jgi:hypothetical protein